MAYETTTTVRRPMAPVDAAAAARVGPIIMWSGVFAGGAVAIALDALFAVLGGAIGATEFNPYALGQGALNDLTLGEGIWLLGSNLVAFFIGGYVGARASVYPGTGHGLLQGLTVWAAALVVSVFLANIALSTGLGHAVTAGAASGAATASQNAAASMSALPSSEQARIVKTTAETIAWWTFAAIALGAIGGVVGGGLGAIRAPRREYVTPTAPNAP